MSVEFFDQRLASLKTDLKVYGGEIVDYVSSLYSINQPDSRFELKNDAFSMLNVLQIDVAEILKESQQRTDQKSQHAVDIEECNQLTRTLAHISALVDMIADCEALISQMKLVPACHAIEKINIALEGLPGPNTEIGSGQVCRILKKECKLLNSRLSSKLTRILKESVQFEFGHISVHQELRGVLRSEDTIINDPIELKDVWTAINLSGRDDEAADLLLRGLWTYALRPLWREKKAPAPRVNRAAEHGIAGVAELVLDSIAREGRSLESGNHTKTGSGPRNPFSELGACKMPLPQLLDCLGQIFEFFYTDVLCANQQAADSVAAKLSSAPISLMPTLITTISHHLPKTEPELALFRRTLEAPCRLLEAKLRNFGFFHDTSADHSAEQEGPLSGPLSDYITDLPSIFADLRRREILKTAREVVLSDYHNTMMAMGDATEDELSSAGDIGDPRAALEVSVSSFALQKLKFDPCQTSLAACRLLKLINDVMRQAAAPSASAQVAHVLFQSARDCLELFMAIVPMQFAHIIEHNARMGAVFYNDCLYIAHNCTLISHRYRAELGEIDAVLSSTVGFLDFIPRLRSLGDKCLSRHIEAQKAQLETLVGNINISPDGMVSASKPSTGAGSTGSGAVKSSSGSASGAGSGALSGSGAGRVGLLSGGLALAGKIGSKIKQGLSESDALYNANGGKNATNSDDAAVLVRRHLEGLSSQWLGVLQETVYARLMGYLLEAVLRESMKPVLGAECIAEAEGAEICRVYRSLQHIRLIFPSGEGREEEALARVCASWRKFLALTDLLEYTLTDVAEWLPRKKFASFTGSEVTSLIRALFEDTPRRQTILASILEMSS